MFVLMRRRALAIAFLVTLLAGSLQAQRGALVKPRSLDQLTAQAERIVHGHIVSAKVEPHPQYANISTVLVTVRVAEMLKGTAPKEFTFRQFIWDIRDKRDASGFRKGKEVVLFLNKATSIGLTSTSGLDQGRFEVERDNTGHEFIRAHAPNQVLLGGVPAALAKKGSATPASIRSAQADNRQLLSLSDFKTTVRALAGTRSTQ
jgi:hypothetical protein